MRGLQRGGKVGEVGSDGLQILGGGCAHADQGACNAQRVQAGGAACCLAWDI